MTKEEYKSKLFWLEEIPKTWDVRPLWAVSKEQTAKSSVGELLSVYLDRGVIRAGEGSLGTHVPSDDMSNYQVIKPGDFILNNQQAWRGSVGVSFENGIISPAYIVLALSQNLDWKYANYLFRSKIVIDQFMLASQGVGSIQRQIHAPSFKNVLIIIPPLETQQRIVDFLDEKTKVIDELIEKKEKLIELLREKRTALITRAVTKGLDPYAKLKSSGVEWLGDVPAGWDKLPLKFLFAYQSGGVWGDDERHDEHDIICIRVADFDFIRLTAHSSDYTLRNLPKINPWLVLNDASILLEKSGGGDQSPVGRAVRYLERQKVTCSNFIQKLQTNKKYRPEFIVLLLSALYFIGVTKKAIKQTTGIQNLDLGFFMRTDIFLPPSEEQQNIVDYVKGGSGHIVDTIEKVESQIEKLKEYRSSLIYFAITGKIKI